MPHATPSPFAVPSAALRDADGADEPPAALSIDAQIAPGVRQRVDRAWLVERLHDAASIIGAGAGSSIASVSVLIVNDARMVDLHQRHSGIASTTDVLTFDLRHDRSDPIEADVVVCADQAARRASGLGHSIDRELLLYCVHGLLHCAGYDDHDEAGWERMHAREDEILIAIGVGSVFNAKSVSPSDGGHA